MERAVSIGAIGHPEETHRGLKEGEGVGSLSKGEKEYIYF
jgi:hypothetical protein